MSAYFHKMIEYIARGQGLGLKYLFIFAVVVAIVFGIEVKINGVDMIPYAQKVADQMLPVTVVNGVVTQPENTVKTAAINFNDGTNFQFPLVIDTRSDSLTTEGLKDGIYLTRTALYTVQGNQVRLTKLEGNYELPRADYTAEFRSMLNWTAVLSAVFGSFFCFIIYFLLGIFYAVCYAAVAKLSKRSLNFDIRMRLAALALIATYLFFWLLSFLGGGSSQILFFLIMIALGCWIISYFPKTTVKA